MEALYAFLRITDDLADAPAPRLQRQQALCQWRQALQQVLQQVAGSPVNSPPLTPEETEKLFGLSWSGMEAKEGKNCWQGVGSSGRPGSEPPGEESSPGGIGLAAWQLEILPALADTVARFGIPPLYLYAVVEGVGMDLEGTQYETFDHLSLYCRRVASAVGLACLCIWGSHRPEAVQPAIACGLAFQLTNILRDLQEDARQGRRYLPSQELRAFGYSEETFPPSQPDDRFDRLIQHEVARVEAFYRQAAQLWEYLDRPGQRIFGMMYQTYYRLLAEIAQNPRKLLQERVSLTIWEKLLIALRWTLWPSRRWLASPAIL